MAVNGKTDLQVVTEVIETLTAVPTTCCFWACPGPDARFVHMATCCVCASVQDLRKLKLRMERQAVA